jgi:ATP-dependent DNA helicase DinG
MSNSAPGPAKTSSELCRFFPFSKSIRGPQVKALAAIERAYHRGKRFILLELPTGTGKSAIAIAAARWASSWGSGAYILSPQKALTAQYMRDFAADGLVELRGRASYRCEDFESNCDIGARLRRKNLSACEHCPYRLAKDEFTAQSVGVTNFDYFLAETLYARQLPRRSLIVVDEAHNLEQKIIAFTDFEIAPSTLQRYSVAIPPIVDGDLRSASLWIRREMIPAVGKFIFDISEDDIARAEIRRQAENLLQCMRRFLAADQKKWAFWRRGKKLVFRPLHAAQYAREFLFSRAQMVLIMSATILDFAVFSRNLGIGEEDCECLALASDFPVKNRPLFYRPLGSMNFRQKAETLPKIAAALDKLLRARADRKGLIHTNSYEINGLLTRALVAAGHRDRIITHEPGGAETALERHSSHPGPTVLCSPAMTEGLDLRDDLSRFQVVVKVPYPNFTDPYVAARKRLDRDWYFWQTAMRLIQATGRSVRSPDDFAETYIVDRNFEDFQRRCRHLLPSWWLAAVCEPRERKPPSSAISSRPELHRRRS